MTGPAYPPPPSPGSNSVGTGQIGIMSIGDVAFFNVWTTILSEYANSPILTSIITSWDSAFDPTPTWSNFYDSIWNVNTAFGYGLDLWGRIVGVSRALNVPSTSYFGFQESGLLANGFNNGTFYQGVNLTTVYLVPDTPFRFMILAKAAANISSDSSQSINTILRTLFPGRGNAYVQDGYAFGGYFGFQESGNAYTFGQAQFNNAPVSTLFFGFQEAGNEYGFGQEPFSSTSIPAFGSMTMTYNFKFKLTPVELAIVQQSGILPRPAGVSTSIVTL